ncbi:hypothetical protein SUGI_0174650 [Cryptomeria japonica]|nr:hypothetical protein SUGI_0174650 [Cryptomeria japonica]
MPLYLAAWLSILYMIMVGECSDSSVVMIESSSVGEIYAACNVVKYSHGTQFDANVNEVLKTLADKTPKTGFSCVTGSEDQLLAKCESLPKLQSLQGRLQCRGDLSPPDCRACSEQAVESIRRDCPNAIGARVQLEFCFLRYENYSFLSKVDSSYWYGLVNVNSDNDERFNEAARGLMADLSTKAPMCWRDVSAKDCATCLSKGIEQMFSCCSGRVGVQIFMDSCNLRYEIYPIAKHY